MNQTAYQQSAAYGPAEEPKLVACQTADCNVKQAMQLVHRLVTLSQFLDPSQIGPPVDNCSEVAGFIPQIEAVDSLLADAHQRISWIEARLGVGI